MDRAEWLKKMRINAEALYDKFAPQYWVTYGYYENMTHMQFLQKLLDKVKPNAKLLSAGCGAGRYDGFLLEAGHRVVGTDQSEGMLKRAREHFPVEQFPQLQYENLGFQELGFHDEFDGVICIDAMEHVSPEDYPVSLRKFQEALKPGGLLYFTAEVGDPVEIEKSYQRSMAKGLPVIYGEVADRVITSPEELAALDNETTPGSVSDPAVYHYYPSLEQVRQWLSLAGLRIIEEGEGSGYHHFIARKSSPVS